MKTDDLRFLLMLGVIGAAGYVGWKAWSGGAGLLSGAGASIAQAWDDISTTAGAAWDSVTETIRAPVEVIANGTPTRVIVANVTRPPVQTAGASLQRPHVTDLPEGSYQAAAMFWSLHPDAVFYD